MVLGTPAIAADMPVTRPAPVYTPGPNWTGFYFGAAFGGGWTHLNASSVSSSTDNELNVQRNAAGAVTGSFAFNSVQNSTSSASGSKFGGAFADLILGYSALVSPAWVAGVQVEGTLADMIFHADGTRASSSTSSGTSFNAAGALTGSNLQTSTTTGTTEFAVKMHWSTAAMARLGWLVTPSTLLYGTGGVTYAGFGDGFNGDTFRAWGWSAGGGVEQKLGFNWSVRLEYRFTDFQDRTATSTFSNSSASTNVGQNAAGVVTDTTTSTGTNSGRTATNYDPQMHTVRLGIVYTFN
jgi:outer membrane immunogenic protein